MSQSNRFNRRQFLKASAGVIGAFTIVPRHVLGGNGHVAPSEMLNHAIIGCGGICSAHLGYVAEDPRRKLVALCDVDSDRLAGKLAGVDKGVKGYEDFRDVLARPDVDVVHVATPPHWHGLMSVAAAEAGKDIWCEKPMTRTIYEGQKVVEAVQRNNRIFRINTWFRFKGGFAGGYHTYDGSGAEVRPTRKLVKSGLLGWPLKVTIGRASGLNWKQDVWVGKTGLVPQSVPDNLNYDMWLGPAPRKYYHPHRTHASFRGYWDYDGGGLGDMGQHYLDPVQFILGKDNTSPQEVIVETQQQHTDAVLPWRRVTYKYADGCEVILDGDNRDENAAFIEGPGGKLYKNFKSDIPNIKQKVAEMPDLEPVVTDFTEAVLNRKKFALNEVNGHRSCTMVNMAKIAVRLGRNLKFDPDKQMFIGDDEANRMMRQPMRAPWVI
ncbi:Inositol 2-dehydrogenase [Anaerohalosphaera lusitana]|uniref:Inositol 2-dehydrogenase n=1 Tax=Anaerohalosphaera lusitana TaxID=1936003 RepID=A0A1U9NLR2_9BACT|nr:Gfo/Idh/MocA family oxidoreductase [Anaerohalosphaera lusitana]AQT68674.1 Inositol 2-dehydrogenase [Anaerohalosphaera lusitana]